MGRFAWGMILVISVACSNSTLADDRPVDRRPLSKIVLRLEKSGYLPIVELEFDDGVLEIEAFKGDQSVELRVDPRTGEIRSERETERHRRPPDDALPLSEVLRKLDKAGYSKVREVGFDRKDWKIEVIKDQREWNLRVDPLTGKVISKHKDD
jgi:uncharacterized membrane protein YkoI